jgi:hypothetical protein
MATLKGLSSSDELITSALAATLVYGIFQLNAPNLSNVKAAKAGNQNAHNSVKTAAWTSAVVTAGVALLAKSPTVFVVGAALTTVEVWKYNHANVTNPATGKIDPSAFTNSE